MNEIPPPGRDFDRVDNRVWYTALMTTIKIYSTPQCGYCRMAKEYFRSKGLAFEDYDVSQDMDKQRELMEKTGGQFLGVPVIEINGKIILGFDKPKVDQYLSQ